MPERPSAFRRGLRIATRSVALVFALLLLGISVLLHDEDAVPAFYDTPATVPTTPGELLDSESFTSAIPDEAQGWRILYSTTTTNGDPAAAPSCWPRRIRRRGRAR